MQLTLGDLCNSAFTTLIVEYHNEKIETSIYYLRAKFVTSS